jgi:hypothetical protein
MEALLFTATDCGVESATWRIRIRIKLQESVMKKKVKPESKFIEMLKKYINIKGLDMILYLEDGNEI